MTNEHKKDIDIDSILRKLRGRLEDGDDCMNKGLAGKIFPSHYIEECLAIIDKTLRGEQENGAPTEREKGPQAANGSESQGAPATPRCIIEILNGEDSDE